MTFRFRGLAPAARSALFVAALMSRAAHAATLDSVLADARDIASQAVDVGRALSDLVATTVAQLPPRTLQAGLIGLSLLVAAVGVWLLMRHPAAVEEDALEFEAVARSLPDRRTEAPASPGISPTPRLLEAVAAMKAQRALSEVTNDKDSDQN